MNHPFLVIVARYIHVLSFITLVGGLLYNMVGQRIARKVLDAETAETFITAFKGRILNFQWIAMLGLIISGLYTWVITNDKYKELGALGNALIGTKVMLAMTVFCVIWMRYSKLIKSDKTAMMINIHLAAIIILLGATLRYYRLSLGS
jgi:hypothetical protein